MFIYIIYFFCLLLLVLGHFGLSQCCTWRSIFYFQPAHYRCLVKKSCISHKASSKVIFLIQERNKRFQLSRAQKCSIKKSMKIILASSFFPLPFFLTSDWSPTSGAHKKQSGYMQPFEGGVV